MKTRIIKTGIYTDETMLGMTPDVRFICVYLYTNDHIRLNDIYKIPVQLIQLETGYDISTIKIALDNLQNAKVVQHYNHLWVRLLRNDFASLEYKGEKNDVALQKYIDEIPKEVIEYLYNDTDILLNEQDIKKTKRYVFSSKKRQEILDTLGRKCNNCGKIDCYFEIDHILRVKDGGSDDMENLQVLCMNCHSNKTKKENYPNLDTSIGVVSDFLDTSYKSEIINNKSKIINNYSEEFENFWKMYPKKVGKTKAYQFWKKLTKQDIADIFADIPKRKNDDKWVNGFVKDPERYIKTRQWEDTILQKVQPITSVDLRK